MPRDTRACMFLSFPCFRDDDYMLLPGSIGTPKLALRVRNASVKYMAQIGSKYDSTCVDIALDLNNLRMPPQNSSFW